MSEEQASTDEKPRRRRATRREVCERLTIVYKLVLLGAEHQDLCEHAREAQWGIGPAQVRRYQAHALKKMARMQEKNRDKNFARHVQQRRALYARAMEAGDWRTALAIARDEAELLKLYPHPLDDLAARLAELEEQLEAKKNEKRRS